eukprot:SAG31_NODE_2635_length_5340_cov_15.869681_5_plen_136_part_00
MIASGRFDHEHYISMWTKRLVDMGVAIMDAAEANTPEAISQRRVEAAAVAAADTLSCHTERTDVAPAAEPEVVASTKPAQPATEAAKTDTNVTRRRTKGALLGGLRSGKLEEAVAKMEHDVAVEEAAEEAAQASM